MPFVKPISGHTKLGAAQRYLEKEGRALARDFLNLDAPMAGIGEDGLPEYHEYDWASMMDETREKLGNDSPFKGRKARTYKHYRRDRRNGTAGPQGRHGRYGRDRRPGPEGRDWRHRTQGRHRTDGRRRRELHAQLERHGPFCDQRVGHELGRPGWPSGADGRHGAAGTSRCRRHELHARRPALTRQRKALRRPLRLAPLDVAHPKIWAGNDMPVPARGGMSGISISSYGLEGIEAGDFVMNPWKGTIARAESVSGGYVSLRCYLEIAGQRGIVPTTALDLDAGEQGSALMNVYGPPVLAGTLILNTQTGALMVASSAAAPTSATMGYATVSATGLGNVFGGGATYTASSPLSIDANDVISIDLTSYATKQYVDDAIAAILDRQEEEF